MKTTDKEYTDNFLTKALENCQSETANFRSLHLDVIASLLMDHRYKDLTDLFFKQGFLAGMRFNGKMRDELTEAVK